jgi:hypothetical protein
MVKPVRESRLATIPTVRELLPPCAAVAKIGPDSVAGVEHVSGDPGAVWKTAQADTVRAGILNTAQWA